VLAHTRELEKIAHVQQLELSQCADKGRKLEDWLVVIIHRIPATSNNLFWQVEF